MLENLFFLFILIMVIIGMASAIQWLLLRILTPKGTPDAILIVPIGKNEENVELALRSADLRARLLGNRFCKQVVAVDCGMDDETYQICTMASREMDSVTVCDLRDLGCLFEHGEEPAEIPGTGTPT